jgi:recombination protein RecA
MRTKKSGLDKLALESGFEIVDDLKNVVTTTNFERIRELTDKLNKKYKKNIIKTGNSIPEIIKVPFNEIVLDWVSDGGIPVGRVTEFLGTEHSGKTRNALKMIHEFQKFCFNCNTANVLKCTWIVENGQPIAKKLSCIRCKNPKTGICVMVDIEGTTDPKFMKYFGIDISGVLYFRPELPSIAINYVEAFLRSPEISLILVDSVGATSSDPEIENAFEDNLMNKGAITLNKAVRKWQAALNSNSNLDSKSPTTMIIVNQSYSTIGAFVTEVPQGGRGLKHGKSLSLKTRIDSISTDDKTRVIEGVHIIVENKKNKAGIPYRKASYYLNLNKRNPLGYCQTDNIIQAVDIGLLLGVIEANGSWYTFLNEKFQGKLAVAERAKNDLKFFEKLKYSIIHAY